MEDATRPLITAVSHGEKIAIRGNTERNGSSRRRFAWMNGIQVLNISACQAKRVAEGWSSLGAGLVAEGERR